MPNPPVILSLFDNSGQWAKPFADAGCDVYCIDIQRDGDLGDIRKFSVARLIEELGLDDVDGILSANPCTDFTRSGALHWKRKDADGSTAASVELVLQTLRTVEYFQPDFWVIENPIGRLPTLVPQLTVPSITRFTWDPCNFAGYLDFTAADLERIQGLRDKERLALPFDRSDINFIREANLYTKRTVLWGDYKIPETKHIAPISVCEQGSWLQTYGGKSERTKNARSETPEGFARAFAAANAFTPETIELGLMRRAARNIAGLELADEQAARRELESEYGFSGEKADRVLEMLRGGDRGKVDFTPIIRRPRVRI